MLLKRCWIIVAMLLLGCKNETPTKTLIFDYKSFSTMKEVDFQISDTSSFVLVYFNFDCSSCIAAMKRMDEKFSVYTNICYLISSKDSIITDYYVDEMNPNGKVLYDKRDSFVNENKAHYDFYDGYPVFVVQRGNLVFERDPFKSKLDMLKLKRILKKRGL